jgi:hypothetical protein
MLRVPCPQARRLPNDGKAVAEWAVLAELKHHGDAATLGHDTCGGGEGGG